MDRKAWLVGLVVGSVPIAVAVAMTSRSPGGGGPRAPTEGAPTAGALTGGAPTPQAPQLPTPASVLGPVFDVLDCDDQGVIDQGQVDEHFGQLFRPLDLDRSHVLSRGELVRGTGARRAHQEAVFALADGDRDGVVSAREYRAHLHAMVRLADADRDGEVSRAELAATEAPPRGR